LKLKLKGTVSSADPVASGFKAGRGLKQRCEG